MIAATEPAELLGRRIALISVGVGVALSVGKIWMGIAAHSTAVVSDGVEAAADVLSSAIVYTGLLLASKPPDDDHPYGHGRYETLAGLAVGGMLFLTGTAIAARSFFTFGRGSGLHWFALLPLFIAIVAKVALAVTKFRAAKRIASPSLQADAWHDLTDLISTLVALLAVSLSLHDPVRFHAADQLAGMMIGVIILFLSIRVVLHTVNQLVDTMPEPGMMAQVRQAALRVPGALGIEKCFARRTGLRYHVDLHLEVDPQLTVRESHAIATQVRINIKESIGWVADVLVHVEPAPGG